MLTINEVKADIARLEKRLIREMTQVQNTKYAIIGAKDALTIMEKETQNDRRD